MLAWVIKFRHSGRAFFKTIQTNVLLLFSCCFQVLLLGVEHFL